MTFTLVKIWGCDIDIISSFLRQNNIIVPDDEIQIYISMSQLSAKLNFLSSFEKKLVQMDNFEKVMLQRPDLTPPENLTFSLISLSKGMDKDLFSDVDEEGDIMDPISFDKIDIQDFVIVNGRSYNTSTIIAILNNTGRNSKDPFNSDKLLIESLKNQILPTSIINFINNLSEDGLPGEYSIFQAYIRRNPNFNITCEITQRDNLFEIKLERCNRNVPVRYLDHVALQFNMLIESVIYEKTKLKISLGLNDFDLRKFKMSEIGLNTLDLSNNKLLIIPTHRNITRFVRILNLQHNNIIEDFIYTDVSRYFILEELYLDNNHITSMSSFILSETLINLSLKNNRLKQVNLVFLPLSLRLLLIRNNPISLPDVTETRLNRIFGVKRNYDHLQILR